MLYADTVDAGSPEDWVFSGLGWRCCVRFNGDVNWPTHIISTMLLLQTEEAHWLWINGHALVITGTQKESTSIPVKCICNHLFIQNSDKYI